MFDLIFFKALLILVTWELESFIKLLEFSKFIGTITCFLNRPFIVMFNFSFNLFSSLITFWIFLIFLFWRLENTSLILRVSLAGLELEDNTWVYDFFLLFVFFLKNLEISTTSLGDFAGIEGEMMETDTSLSASLPFLGILFLFIWRLNWAFTLCLKEKLFLSAIRWFQ